MHCIILVNTFWLTCFGLTTHLWLCQYLSLQWIIWMKWNKIYLTLGLSFRKCIGSLKILLIYGVQTLLYEKKIPSVLSIIIFQVITASRCLVLCAENRSEMETWAGALRGALHRGADVADLVASISSGDHHW